MKFFERLAFFILRPIYRGVFERPVWWFLAKVKTFFFSEIGVQLGNFERRFQTEDAVDEQRWACLERRLQCLEANNAAQWDALEQLLLALFRQPELTNSELTSLERNDNAATTEQVSIPAAIDLKRVHAASHLR